jgi:hypothetical protein
MNCAVASKPVGGQEHIRLSEASFEHEHEHEHRFTEHELGVADE